QSFQNNGIRIRLTGLGGDQWLMGNVRHTADLLRRLKLWNALRQVRMDSKVLSGYRETVSPLVLLARSGLIPLLPRSVVRVSKRLLRHDRIPFWIEPQFARKTGLAERLNANSYADRATSPFPSIVQRDLWNMANSGRWGLLLEWNERHSFSF